MERNSVFFAFTTALLVFLEVVICRRHRQFVIVVGKNTLGICWERGCWYLAMSQLHMLVEVHSCGPALILLPLG